MDASKLTEKAQEAIASAQRLAEQHRHTQLEPEHLLYALVTQEQGVVPALLLRMSIEPRQVLQRVESALRGFAQAQSPTQVTVSNRFRRLLDAAANEARQLNDEYISTEHYLLALTDDRGAGGSVLRELGITRDRVYEALQEVRGGQRITSATPEATYEAL